MRGRLWIHDWTNWRLCNALASTTSGQYYRGKTYLRKFLLNLGRRTVQSMTDSMHEKLFKIQKHLCLGHKRSQMKQLLPKTWITFITITVRQSRMFIMQVWWRFYDSLCSECWISCFGYCCENEWYMCFTFPGVFCFHALGGKWTSLVNMEVMQGICFFSCITKSPGVLDWNEKLWHLLPTVE